MNRGAAGDSSAVRLFVIAGSVAVLLFVFLTPPFKVPDEVGHFWRAASIAQGTIVPRSDSRGARAEIPVGLKTLVYIFYTAGNTPGQQKIGGRQFRLAFELPLEPAKIVTVTIPAGYTPVAYAPQIAAALIGRVTDAKPVVTFYLGRLLSALAFIGIIALAIRITPVLRWLFCAAGLLPMALYLAASWSADAMTIAASFLFLALLLRACGASGPLRRGEIAALAGAGALVGLAKPGYFLTALLILAVPAARSRRRGAVIALVLLVVAGAGTASILTVVNSGAAGRGDVHVDVREQLDCIRDEPLRFARVIVDDFRVRGSEYASQCVGRLGMLDVWLPRPVIWAELLVLLIAAASSEGAIGRRLRAIAAVVFVIASAGIAVSLYLSWTPPCSGVIDGIQGRYFLPLVPLIGVAAGFRGVRDRRVPLVAIAVTVIAATLAAGLAIMGRYYS